LRNYYRTWVRMTSLAKKSMKVATSWETYQLGASKGRSINKNRRGKSER